LALHRYTLHQPFITRVVSSCLTHEVFVKPHFFLWTPSSLALSL
jgi:hypothetical protein